MKIDLLPDGMLIEPETDFEEQYIGTYIDKCIKIYVKHGASVSELIGLKIQTEEKKRE